MVSEQALHYCKHNQILNIMLKNNLFTSVYTHAYTHTHNLKKSVHKLFFRKQLKEFYHTELVSVL